ncbi:MAG: hypothetical protein [brine shrimp arlivirus 4]|nr:MAG: hypothetical protein [brine shrimp arlivirus 4]
MSDKLCKVRILIGNPSKCVEILVSPLVEIHNQILGEEIDLTISTSQVDEVNLILKHNNQVIICINNWVNYLPVTTQGIKNIPNIISIMSVEPIKIEKPSYASNIVMLKD